MPMPRKVRRRTVPQRSVACTGVKSARNRIRQSRRSRTAWPVPSMFDSAYAGRTSSGMRLLDPKRLIALPVRHGVYVQICVCGQPMCQDFDGKPNCLCCVVAGVVGGGKGIQIKMRGEPIAEAPEKVIISACTVGSGINALRRKHCSDSRREERRRVLGNILRPKTGANLVLEALVAREPRNGYRCQSILLRTEISALSQREEA